MERVYNFSAGPAALPLPVLEKARDEMVTYRDKGMSVMEMSHRSQMFLDIYDQSVANIQKLMNIPSQYKVLFLQGGASSQFAMVPLNLLKKEKTADYVNTGQWSKKAIQEAKRYGNIHVVASSEDQNFSYIPTLAESDFSPNADYVHITWNNTIYGTKFSAVPPVGSRPLVTDMSSSILSEAIDVSKFGLIYAGAQKNIGPAGLVIAIIREDLIGDTLEGTPAMFQYKIHADNDSMYNTPPTYSIYIANLVFEWLLSLGGIAQMEAINKEKAALLYDYLDNSNFFASTVKNPQDRSLMNVPFVLKDAALDSAFLEGAKKNGLVNLKGHRSVGGMRASIYNAMPKEGVQALVDFMKQFETEHK